VDPPPSATPEAAPGEHPPAITEEAGTLRWAIAAEILGAGVLDEADAVTTVVPPAPVIPGRRLRRHRREVGVPALLEPMDIPEDAEGRVIFIATGPPPDVVAGVVDVVTEEDIAEVTESLGPMEHAVDALTRMPVRLLMRGGIAGWLPVGLLAVIFVVAFVAGMRLAK
jgi:hypothetical protein